MRQPAQPTPRQAERLPRNLREAYRRMRAHFGHQHWWPGETPFEICVGAILTQNTNWTNVERAIANLKRANLLDPVRLHGLPEAKLAQLIRPAGYFNVKARRIRAFLAVLVHEFDADLARCFSGELSTARERLLRINGIGPETADSMLLYAGSRLSFVVDAYTRRIFSRHQWCLPEAGYEELQRFCAAELEEPDAADQLDLWQDYHAQLVMVGKTFCHRSQPRCQGCPLADLLPAKGPSLSE